MHIGRKILVVGLVLFSLAIYLSTSMVRIPNPADSLVRLVMALAFVLIAYLVYLEGRKEQGMVRCRECGQYRPVQPYEKLDDYLQEAPHD